MLNFVIIAACAATAALLLWPPLARAPLWRAAITPLASIIGSGFLVLGPILNASFGALAVPAMALLCAAAYAFGSAIRYNIARIARSEHASRPRSRNEHALEAISSWALAAAYIISVAYYLNLLGSFAMSLSGLDDPYHAKLVTTAVYVIILLVGWFYGFATLERLEQISVGIKLSIIAGLLVGMAVYFEGKWAEGALVINPPYETGWAGIALLFGLVVTVQGFETSRYLGAEYSPALRIRSMKVAQVISALIYLCYIGLLSFAFAPGTLDLHETAIIDLMQIVAPILPVLLVFAALSAQFSAAVADTGGSGGLLSELTGGRIPPRAGYAILVGIGLALTWGMSVFEIIGYASRAFALYYAIQSAIAALGAAQEDNMRVRMALYAALCLLGLAIALFGTSVE